MMILFVLLACLAFVAVLPLLLPLLRRSQAVPERGQFDRVVYSDQLQELDRDVARGFLTAAEATSARLEIQRRLLAADTVSEPVAAARAGRSPMLASIIVLFAAGGAGAVYLRLGAPGIPDSPFVSRAALANEAPSTAAEPAGHNDLSQALGQAGGEAESQSV